MIKYAHISGDGLYRYVLGRRWAKNPAAVFIMLNPSTADADLDDPTIRRCTGFARSWGLGAINVVNLYALRATNPGDLWKAPDPVGPENDEYLRGFAYTDASVIVAAWGTHGKPDRVERVRTLLGGQTVHCLGVTKSGAPKHPLYLAANTALRVWP